MNTRVTALGICKKCGSAFKLYKGRSTKFCCLPCYHIWRVERIDTAEKRNYQRKWHNANRVKDRERLRARDKENYKRNREKIVERNKRYYAKNINGYKERARLRTLLLKLEIVGEYSNNTFECAICGEKRWECLSIDHTKGGGNVHRKQLGNLLGQHFYLWLKRNNYPEGYRILCMNCQFIERERLKQK